jgi:hydroxylaminobenzene mutase
MVPPNAKRRFLWHGMLILLFGLLAGALVPWLGNPRMGVAAHVGGVLSGTFLILVGLIWEEIKLPVWAKKADFWLFLYASHTGWLAQFLAAVFGTGRSMPVAGAGFRGTAWQEAVVDVVAISFSIIVALACVLALHGLRRVAVADGETPAGGRKS